MFDKDSFMLTFMAGAIGGTTANALTCPLEVIQTRLQSHNNYYNSVAPNILVTGNNHSLTIKVLQNYLKSNIMLKTIRDTWKFEGLHGFYKGLPATIIGVAPTRAVYFSVYAFSQKKLDSIIGEQNKNFKNGLCGVLASMSAATCTNPIWIVKTRLQLNKENCPMFQSIVSTIRYIYSNDGLVGFYRGITSSYYGTVESMLYFILYEYMKDYFKAINNSESLTLYQNGQSAAISKSIAAIAAYPHEVVRTRMRQSLRNPKTNQLIYKSFWQSLFKIFNESGYRSLYSGMGMHLIRQIPNTTIMFVSYESMLKLLSSSQ